MSAFMHARLILFIIYFYFILPLYIFLTLLTYFKTNFSRITLELLLSLRMPLNNNTIIVHQIRHKYLFNLYYKKVYLI